MELARQPPRALVRVRVPALGLGLGLRARYAGGHPPVGCWIALATRSSALIVGVCVSLATLVTSGPHPGPLAPSVQAPKRPKKARGVIMAETYSKSEKYVKRVYPKSETTKAMLRQVLSQSFMFETLTAADMDEVVDAMKERRVTPGDKVITQGSRVVCASR